MKVETVPIGSIHIDPANVRRHPERNMAAIAASLARFGQQRPILVDGKGIVRAGNGTLEAARSLGWDEIKIVRTELVGSEATAYALADNRTAELAGWDDGALAETLRALQSEDYPIEVIGWMDTEVDELLARLGDEAVGANGEPVDDPQGEWQGMPEFESEDNRPAAQLTVYFGSETDKERFGQIIGQSLTAQTKWVWHPPRESPKGMRYVEDEHSATLPDLYPIERAVGSEAPGDNPIPRTDGS